MSETGNDLGWVHAVERINDKLDMLKDSFTNQLGALREDLAAIKAVDNKSEIEQLKARVSTLENAEFQRTGAVKLGEWFYKVAPWLFAIALVAFNNYNRLK